MILEACHNKKKFVHKWLTREDIIDDRTPDDLL